RNKVDFRNFDKKRISYIRTIPTDSSKTQLWLIPPGSKRPVEAKEIDTGFVLSELRPRFLFADSPYQEGDCPEVKSRQLFASVLKANPAARANIVIRFTTLERSRREQSRLMNF